MNGTFLKIFCLEEKGIEGVTGEIDYPKLRQMIKVELTDNDRTELIMINNNIKMILELELPPEVINKPFCKQCSYYELCYV